MGLTSLKPTLSRRWSGLVLVACFISAVIGVLLLTVGMFSAGWARVSIQVGNVSLLAGESVHLNLGLWNSYFCYHVPVIKDVCTLVTTDEFFRYDYAIFDARSLGFAAFRHLLNARTFMFYGYVVTLTAFILLCVYILRPQTQLGALTAALWIVSVLICAVMEIQEGHFSSNINNLIIASPKERPTFSYSLPWSIITAGVGTIISLVTAVCVIFHIILTQGLHRQSHNREVKYSCSSCINDVELS